MITPGQEQLLRSAEDKIREFGKNGVRAVLGIGKELSRVKAAIGHGHYIEWIETSFGWSRETAGRYVSTYETWGKTVTVTDLENFDLGALYALNGPGKVQAREKLLGEARQGARITHGRARRELNGDDADDGVCGDGEPAPTRTSSRVAELVSKLRGFDMEDEPPEDLAELVQPPLRPALAAKCYRIAGWLTDLARRLDGVALAP